jgi:hypothetical protein
MKDKKQECLRNFFIQNPIYFYTLKIKHIYMFDLSTNTP